jgi:hypothetical protein
MSSLSGAVNTKSLPPRSTHLPDSILISTLMLSSIFFLDFPVDRFPRGLLTRILYAFLDTPTIATSPVQCSKNTK